MGKRNLFTLTVLLMLISVTSFSGVESPIRAESLPLTADSHTVHYWTCYAIDADNHTFPGLEKSRQAAQKTAVEKCSFFSEASGTCRPSQEDCDMDEL